MQEKHDWLHNDHQRQPDRCRWWSIFHETEGYSELEYRVANEPLLREFRYEGDRIGIVTRNRYEAEVLNSPMMLVADVDIGDPKLQDGCFVDTVDAALDALKGAIANVSAWATCDEPSYWLMRFGEWHTALKASDLLKHPHTPMVDDPAEAKGHPWAILRIKSSIEKEQFVDSLYYGLGFRVYRTFGGLRYICTTHLFSAGMEIEDRLLRFCLSDPRYRRICKQQMTFRSRLSPKPWRVDLMNPNPTTCSFVGVIGRDEILPEFREMIDYHDKTAKAYETGILA